MKININSIFMIIVLLLVLGKRTRDGTVPWGFNEVCGMWYGGMCEILVIEFAPIYPPTLPPHPSSSLDIPSSTIHLHNPLKTFPDTHMHTQRPPIPSQSKAPYTGPIQN